MTSQAESRTNLPAIQSFFYFSGSLLACCGLAWVLMQLAHYFSSVVMLAGLVILFVYLLLAPVNIIHRLLQKPFLALHARLPIKFVSSEFVAHLSRATAIVLMYLVFFVFTSIATIRFVPVTVTQLGGFLETVPTYMESVEGWLGEQPWLEKVLSSVPKIQTSSAVQDSKNLGSIAGQSQMSTSSLTPKQRLKQNVDKTNQQLQSYLAAHIHDGVNNFLGFIGTTLTGLVYALTALVLVFYLRMIRFMKIPQPGCYPP